MVWNLTLRRNNIGSKKVFLRTTSSLETRKTISGVRDCHIKILLLELICEDLSRDGRHRPLWSMQVLYARLGFDLL
jgi:hypothetical protein